MTRKRLLFESLEKRILLVSDWTNAFNARDVDDSGLITPLDVLLGINEINTPTFISETGKLPNRTQFPDEAFYDVSGDGRLSALDILLVVNGINNGFTPPSISMTLARDTAANGTLNQDGITWDATVTGGVIQGSNNPVTDVTLQVDGGERISRELGSSNVFTFNPSLANDGTQDGEHVIRVTAFDGSVIVNAYDLSFVLDTTPPAVPANLSLTDESDLGFSNADEITSATDVFVTGDADVDSTVAVIIDSARIGQANANVPWQVPASDLTDGNLLVTATATDVAGNESDFATPLTITVDTLAPDPLLAEPSSALNQVDVYFDTSMGVGADQVTNYQLHVADGAQAGQTVPLVSATLQGALVQLDTQIPLVVGTSYRLTVADSVSDVAGNAIPAPVELDFRVTSSLVINATSPRNGEDEVSLTREAIIRFTEAVDPATVTSQSIKVTALGAEVPGRLAVSSTEKFATFFPSQPWNASSEVRIEVDGDQIIGRSGHALDADLNGKPGGKRVIDFRTLPLTRIEGTDVFGYIYDAYTQLPIEGATVRADGISDLTAVTNAAGFFVLENTPAPVFFVHIDGTTAVNQPAGVGYPNVGKPFHSVAGNSVQLNHHGHTFDIFLPQMATEDIQALSATEATDVGFGPSGINELGTMLPEVASSEWDKLRVTFFPNSAQDDSGNSATQATIIPVPPSRLPAPLPAGFNPKLVISVQAVGANNFDVPAPITFPNLDELPIGSKPTIWSFDHDRGVFAPLGTGEVFDDGSGGTIIQSSPGVGILAPGWHFTSPDLYWAGNEDEPVGNGTLKAHDPIDAPVEAKLFVARDQYTSDYPQDSYTFRFNPPEGADDLSDGEHILSAKTKIARNSSITITNPEWFRVLYELNPEFDRLLGSDGKVNIVSRPGDSPRTLSAKLRTEKEILSIIRQRPDQHVVLSRNQLFVTRMTILERTIVIDPISGAHDTAIFIKDKVPLVWLDIADDKSDGILKFHDLNSKSETIYSQPFGLLGKIKGLTLSAQLKPSAGQSQPAPIFRIGSVLQRSLNVEVDSSDAPNGEPGAYSAKIAFQVTLKKPAGQAGVKTVDVKGLVPEVKARLTPQRKIFLDRELFIQAAAGISQDPQIDYVLLGTELETIIESLTGKPPGPNAPVMLLDGDCGLCDKNGEISLQWDSQASTENPKRFGIAEDTRFDTFAFASNLLVPSVDKTEFIIDDSVPLARQSYLLDTAMNNTDKYGGKVTIHLPLHYQNDVLNQHRGEDISPRDLAVTIAHESLHLQGLVHTDDTGAENRDLMNSKSQFPPRYSFTTKSSARFALDGNHHDSRLDIVRLIAAYARALNQPLETVRKVFPNPDEVFALLSERREPELPVGSELALADINGNIFSDSFSDIGETPADGPAGEFVSRTLVLENYGLEAMEISTIGLLDGTNGFSFSGVSPGLIMNPLETVELVVQFDPSLAGALSNTLAVTGLVASSSEPLEFQFPLSGTGIHVDPTAEVVYELDNNNFAGFELDSPSEARSVLTISNQGAEPLSLTVSIAGSQADFDIPDIEGTQTLEHGESLTIPAVFQPTELGLRRAWLRVATNDPNLPLIEQSLVGTGLPVGGIGSSDFQWGNDYIRLVDGPLINHIHSDRGGNFEVGVSTRSEFSIDVFDPSSGLIAGYTSRSGVSGGFGDVSFPLTFAASFAADSDGDGLPDDIEAAIGSNVAMVDSDGDGLDDFVEITEGLNPLDGLVFPTGLVASLNLPGTSREVIVQGTIDGKQSAYVATGEHGLAIVDVTQFNSPILLGQLGVNGTATDIAVDLEGNHAILATDSGIAQVNIADPMAPSLVRTLPIAGPRIELSAGLLYIANGLRLTTLDLASREVLDDIELGSGTITDIAIEGNLLYTMDSEDMLRIFEIDGSALIARGNLVLPQGGGRLFVGDSIVYAAATNSFRGGFVTIDAFDPDDPQLISGADVEAPFVVPRTAVAATGSGLGVLVGTPSGTVAHTLDVFDLTDLSETNIRLASFALPASPNGVAISSGAAFVVDDNGLQVVNFLPFDNLGQSPTASISVAIQDADPDTEGFQVVEGTTIPIRALVEDDVQVREVQLLVNSRVVHTDVSFPWSLSTTADDLSGSGMMQLQVRAIDTGGNQAFSQVLVMEIVEDSTAPTIESLNPDDGAVGAPGIQVVRIRFSEPMDSSTLTSTNIRLTTSTGSEITPTNIRLRADDRELQFTYPELGVGSYLLSLDEALITDRAGNPIGDATITREFTLEETDVLALYPNRLFDTPEEPYGVAVGDLNGDGYDDVVSANYFDSSVSIFLADGDGGFATRTDISTTVAARSAVQVYLRDISEDGKLDIIVMHSRNTLTTFLGEGDGTFAEPTLEPLASTPALLDFGDVNGDGHIDIFAYRGSSTFLLGEGDGTFTRSDVSFGGSKGAALGDFNQDGFLDVVVEGFRRYDFHSGNGDGTFEAAETTSFSHPVEPQFIVAADFNNDNHLDFAATNSRTFETELVHFFFGNGDGTFAEPVAQAIPGVGVLMLARDLNHDNIPDLAVSNESVKDVSLILSDGQGSFTSQLVIATENAKSLALGDFNQDGNLDLVTPDATNDALQFQLGIGDGLVAGTTMKTLDTVTTVSDSGLDDFNDDGFADLVALADGSKVLLFRGLGDGTFGGAQAIGTVESPTGMLVHDLNVDGIADIAIFSQGRDRVTVFLADGIGNFSRADYTGFSLDAPERMASGDITGDGSPDLVLVTFLDQVVILENNGNGTFLSPRILMVRPDIHTLALADLNNDNRADIITFEQSSSPEAALVSQLANSSGGFDAAVSITMPRATSIATKLHLADLNGDGFRDAIVDIGFSDMASVALGKGDGTFQTRTDHSTLDRNADSQILDADLDGNLDLIVLAPDGKVVELLPGNGVGGFEQPLRFRVGTLPARSQFDLVYLVTGDIDGDGDFDLVAGRNATAAILLKGGLTGLVGGNLTLDPASMTAAYAAAVKLSVMDIAPIYDSAISIWAAVGLSANGLSLLSQFSIGITDLSFGILATASNNAIWLDTDASGVGWYTGLKPESEIVFATQASPTVAPAIDLLTVVLHEMGHLLGLEHDLEPDLLDDLMDEMLGIGVRRLPTAKHTAAVN